MGRPPPAALRHVAAGIGYGNPVGVGDARADRLGVAASAAL